MKYHYLVASDWTPVDPDALSAEHAGRRFISEEAVLSWFEDPDRDSTSALRASGSEQLVEA